MEDVCVKAEVPFMVAKESVELAKGGVDALIGPSIFSILKVNLIELASVEGSSETIDEGTVDVALVLATSLPDLVEVAEHKPTPIGRWLVGHKFREEIVLEVGSRWSVHSGNLEVAVIGVGGVNGVDIRGETVGGGHHICDSDPRIAPK
jgi:hypothetical protein